MNCPKCGLQAVPEQKFCRSCGASLQMITQPLPKSTMVSQVKSQTAIDTREEIDRTNSLLSWGFIIMFVGAAIGVIGKKLMHEDVVTVVGVLVALAGMFLCVYPYVLPSPRRRHNSSQSLEFEQQSEQPKTLPKERTTDYVPSITEGTTDLLTNSLATAKQTEARKSHD